jgi:hypothetical protein
MRHDALLEHSEVHPREVLAVIEAMNHSPEQLEHVNVPF